MSKDVRSHSRVQVLVEVEGSCYGAEWTLADLTKQSGEEAVNLLRNRLSKDGVRIIGEPKVLAITHIQL